MSGTFSTFAGSVFLEQDTVSSAVAATIRTLVRVTPVIDRREFIPRPSSPEPRRQINQKQPGNRSAEDVTEVCYVDRDHGNHLEPEHDFRQRHIHELKAEKQRHYETYAIEEGVHV